ncbi:MAG: hypothetical protein IID61_03850 [SAR324 cluster bacterium]|nr:hypothetical protein [SAR324 cluster bacterium]
MNFYLNISDYPDFLTAGDWRRRVALIMALCAITGLVEPPCVRAAAMLFPNGQRQPGELGAGLGGAHTALARGPEAGWYNPAGMALDADTVIVAGSDLVIFRETRLGGQRTRQVGNGSGFLGFTSSIGDKRENRGLSYGLFLSWPASLENRTRSARVDRIEINDVPSIIDPGGLDFIGTRIDRVRSTSGQGGLHVLSTGAGFGYAFSPNVRFGLVAEWERVSYLQRSEWLTTYNVDSGSGAADSYQAIVHATAEFAGTADRTVISGGIQADFFRFLTVGISARLPSQLQGGRGRYFMRQTSSVDLRSSAAENETRFDRILIEEKGIPFELRSPLVIHLGLGFAGQTGSFEVDIIRITGVGKYTVLPLTESEPPSTTAYRPPPFRTRGKSELLWAAGLSLSLSATSTFLFGMRTDKSTVPGNDPVFRSIDLFAMTGSWLYTRGAFSASLGTEYMFGSRSVRFPSPLGDETDKRKVDYEELALRVSGGFVF